MRAKPKRIGLERQEATGAKREKLRQKEQGVRENYGKSWPSKPTLAPNPPTGRKSCEDFGLTEFPSAPFVKHFYGAKEPMADSAAFSPDSEKPPACFAGKWIGSKKLFAKCADDFLQSKKLSAKFADGFGESKK